jgi:peroxiredoxin
MTVGKRLNFNHTAPDVTLMDTSGRPVRLSSLWARRPLLLAFTRHFGCTQCKEMLEELVTGKKDLEKAGLGIAVTMQGTPEETAAFAAKYAPGLRCLADPMREAYRAYGLERGNVFQTILNPKVWSAVARSRRKGYRLDPPPAGQDAMQMSGLFIIGTQGRILFPYYFDHIADHPPLALLVSGVLATRWDQPFDGPVAPAAPRRHMERGKKASTSPARSRPGSKR